MEKQAHELASLATILGVLRVLGAFSFKRVAKRSGTRWYVCDWSMGSDGIDCSGTVYGTTEYPCEANFREKESGDQSPHSKIECRLANSRFKRI